MEVSRTEAKELIDSYFKTYPKVKEYMEKSVEVAREQGYILTEFGRRRYLPTSLRATRWFAVMRNEMRSMRLSRERQQTSLKLP